MICSMDRTSEFGERNVALVQLTVKSAIEPCNRTKVPICRIIFLEKSSTSGNPAPIKCIRLVIFENAHFC